MSFNYQQYTGASTEYGAVIGKTGLEGILTDWQAAMENMVRVNTEAFRYFGEADFEWSGRDIIVPLQTKLSGSFAAIPEGGTLPRAGKSEFVQSRKSRAHIYGRIQVTGPAIAATKGKKGALFQIADKEMQDLQKSIAAQMDRQFFGYNSGVLADVTTYLDGLVTLNSAYTEGWANTTPLFPGMRVCWGTLVQLATQGAEAGHGEVVSVDSDTTFTIAKLAGADPTGEDFVVCGDDRCNSYGQEFVGLRDFLSATTTVQALDPTGPYPWWVAQSYQANGGAGNTTLTPTLLMTGIVKYGKKFEGKPIPDVMVVCPEVLIEHFDALYPNQRFAPGDYKTGLNSEDALAWVYKGKKIKWFESDLAPRYSITFLEKKFIKYGWQQRLGWMRSRNNGMIMEPVPDVDAVQALYGGYGQMVTLDRRRILQMSEINHAVL